MSGALALYLQPVHAAPEGEADPIAGKIRVTPDGKISVIDAIKGVMFTNEDGSLVPNAATQASGALCRIYKAHPEVEAPCFNRKFPGARQRETPVTDRQGLIEIIQLLPGKKAASFRHALAVLLERYLDSGNCLRACVDPSGSSSRPR